jgi:glycosyltransferase involved in cell wall biosynthesis
MTSIAFLAPLTPIRSALADHAEGILPLLAERFDVTIVTSGTYKPSRPLFAATSTVPIACISYREYQMHRDRFDLVVYQLGDEPEIHGYMLDALPEQPGLVLLNDLVMHHAIIGRTLAQGNPDAYLAEMRYSYGQRGVRLAKTVIAGQADELTWRLPLVERILDQSLAVAGFNRYMCDQITKLRPELPCRLIPYPFYLPAGFPEVYDGTDLRRRLGLQDRPVVASFGFFIPDKRLQLVMRAFKSLLRTHPDAYYLLVGGASPYYDLAAELRAEGLEGHVGLTGWQDPISFVKHMYVADVAVHLRWPHIGGTPYTPIRLLGLGVPTIVSDIEPLAEIPDAAVMRIQPNVMDEEKRLTECMERLLGNPALAEEMATTGQAYIRERHDLGQIADDYVAYFEWAVQERAGLTRHALARREWDTYSQASSSRERLVGVYGEALAGLGLTAQDSCWLRPFADSVEQLVGTGGTNRC